MFYGCENMVIFSSSVDNLLDGRGMFGEDKSLTDFKVGLPKLVSGDGMFYGCNLSLSSLEKIADTIRDVSVLDVEKISTADGGEVVVTKELGIRCANPNSADVLEQIQKIRDKGWTVTI